MCIGIGMGMVMVMGFGDGLGERIGGGWVWIFLLHGFFERKNWVGIGMWVFYMEGVLDIWRD